MTMPVFLGGSKIAESALGRASRLGSRVGFKDAAYLAGWVRDFRSNYQDLVIPDMW